jgi:hypothetical protein
LNFVGLLLEVQIYGAIGLWLLGLAPAAVVSILKGRLLYFFLGWVTFGIAWFVGALSPADPGSLWARRFYDESHPRSAHTSAIWLFGSLGLLLAIGLFAARPVPVLGVDGRALQYSVDGGGFSSSSDACAREDGVWICHVYDSNLSSNMPYRVEMRRFGCWTATRIDWAREESRQRLSGCITIWDEIRLLNTIF